MKKSTLILLLIAVALGAFVYFYEIRGGKEREETEARANQAFQFKQEDIAEMTLTRDGKTVAFQKKDTDWVITEPVSTKADQSAVEAIARELASARIERKLSGSQDNLKSFGLETPRITLTVKLKDGQQHQVRFGEKDFSGSSVYALVDGGGEVALLPSYVLTSADKSLLDLRDKTILSVSQYDVTNLELKTPKNHFVLMKQGSDWHLQQPRSLPADSSTISSILSQMTSATMTDIVAESASDLKPYGLDKPTITARVRTEKGDEHVLTLGAKVDETYYGKSSARSAVFKVSADLYKKLDTTLFDLRSKRALVFNRDDITRVRVKNEHQTIVCEKTGDNKWVVKEPADKKDKEVREYQLFNPLELNDAKEIFDAPSREITAKLAQPAIEVQLTKKDGTTITVVVSKKTDNTVYVRNNLGPTVMKFDGQMFDDLNFKLDDLVSGSS